MTDGNQWSGDAAATAHIPPRDPAVVQKARQVVAANAIDAADLQLLLEILDLGDIAHMETPA